MRVCNIFFSKKLTQTKKFPLANLFARIYVFPLQTIKYRALCFSTKKGTVRVVFKCKLYLKNSIKLTFFVTRISGNKSIIFFWPDHKKNTVVLIFLNNHYLRLMNSKLPDYFSVVGYDYIMTYIYIYKIFCGWIRVRLPLLVSTD